MPNIKSSKKDVISSKIAYEKNKAEKSALKTAVKKFETEATAAQYSLTTSAIDKAVIKGIMHKNAANRKKARLAKKLAAAQ